MPQLDQVTYFSQFFWLVVFLFGYYAILVKNFLPKYSRILKVRNKKIRASNQPEDTWSTILTDIPYNRERLLTDSLQQSRTRLAQSYQTTHQRISTIVSGLEQRVLQRANQSYLSNIAEFGLGLRVISNDVNARDMITLSAQQWYDFSVVSRATS